MKYGRTHYGKQRYRCRGCGRQFANNPTRQPVEDSTRELVDKLLLERLSLAGIARVTGVSPRWLQTYVNQKLESVPDDLSVSPKKSKLTVEMDELWSFVGNKQQKQWVWLAMDRDTREVVGFALGDRSEQTAQQLWDSLPGVYRQCAVCYTDFWEAYGCLLPSKRHRPGGKEQGETNHIERLNNTWCQGISRFVRRALSFSKKIENHAGALRYFLNHYNLSLAI